MDSVVFIYFIYIGFFTDFKNKQGFPGSSYILFIVKYTLANQYGIS